MKLEEAVRLKKGAIVTANRDCCAPPITKGMDYILQASVKREYHTNRDGSRSRKLISVRLPIINDSREHENVVYHYFEPVKVIK